MTTHYKAVRPDGTDFRTGTVRWLPPVGDPMPGGGMVVTHPTSRKRTDGGADGYLSVATVATECTGMRWPCRLAVVEPTRAAVWTPDPGTLPSKRASWQWRVVAEIDAHQALGPQGPEVVAIIDRVRMLTTDELRQLGAARDAARDAARNATWGATWGATRNAARDAARNAARNAARDATWDAAWDATWDAALDAAWGAAWSAVRVATLATLVRDLITPKRYDLLMAPWRTVIGDQA